MVDAAVEKSVKTNNVSILIESVRWLQCQRSNQCLSSKELMMQGSENLEKTTYRKYVTSTLNFLKISNGTLLVISSPTKYENS